MSHQAVTGQSACRVDSLHLLIDVSNFSHDCEVKSEVAGYFCDFASLVMRRCFAASVQNVRTMSFL